MMSYNRTKVMRALTSRAIRIVREGGGHTIVESPAGQSASIPRHTMSEDKESEKRDWEDKRADYERAGIPEYWVIDPQKGSVTLFALKQGRYAIHAEGRTGQKVSSALLPGLDIDVDAVMRAGHP